MYQPTSSQIRQAKQKAVGGGPKRCVKGKSCSATCIDAREQCLVELPESVQGSLGKVRNFLKNKGAHIAEHAATGVVAWKTGKVLAPVVSGFLESQYGIPREASTRMAETVIQAATATALNARHMKDANTFIKNLLTETAAAYLGKTAHSGVESIMDSQQARQIIQQAAPVLAGKVTGIATAFAGGKIPPPAEIGRAIIDRSQQDIQKLMGLVRPQAVGFAEPDYTEVSKVLADIAVAGLILSRA